MGVNSNILKVLIALLLVVNVGVGIVYNKSAEVNTADKGAASIAVCGDVRLGRAAQVAVEMRDLLIDSEPGHRGIARRYAKMDRILLDDRGPMILEHHVEWWRTGCCPWEIRQRDPALGNGSHRCVGF